MPSPSSCQVWNWRGTRDVQDAKPREPASDRNRSRHVDMTTRLLGAVLRTRRGDAREVGEQAESSLPPDAAAILPLEATAVSAGRKRRRRPLSKTSPLVRGGAGQTSASRPLAESRENSRGALRPARSACFSSPDVRPDSPRVRTMLLAPQKVF